MKRNGDAGKMEGFSWRIMGRKFVEKCLSLLKVKAKMIMGKYKV